MQDNNLYRPPQRSLLSGATEKPKRITIGKRFIITLLWAFPIFSAVSVLNVTADQWLAVIAGSSIIALFCGVIAMCIPTRFKSIFVSVSILAGFGLALLS